MTINEKRIDFVFDNPDIEELTTVLTGCNKLNDSKKIDLRIQYFLKGSIDKKMLTDISGVQCIPTDSNILMGNSVPINQFGNCYKNTNYADKFNSSEIGTYGFKEDCFLFILDYKTNICTFYYTKRLFNIIAVYATILRKIIAKYFISHGVYPMHSSAVALNGQGLLLLASSGGGKTTTAINLCTRFGFEMLNDEMNFISDEYLFPLPWPIKAHKDLCTKYNFEICSDLFSFDNEALIDKNDDKIKYINKSLLKAIICLRKESNCEKIEVNIIDKVNTLKYLLGSDLNWYSTLQRKNAYGKFYALRNIPTYEIKYSLPDLYNIPQTIFNLGICIQ